MPIYEYRCKTCGHVFEEFQSVGATGDNLNCPQCKAPAPEKLFSAFASGAAGAAYSGSSAGSGSSCGSGGFG